MAPYVPEEVNVFSVPHSRMKELVHNYFAMIQSTNFTDIVDLQQLLECLSRIFLEFKTHEQIENRFIMKRLKLKLKHLSIKNTAVCNCHKDNNLSEMIRLLKDGYKKKTEQDRLNYGLQLKKALEDFTRIFLPHMKEEEEVFQPLLLQHFTYEELRELKQKVIQQHFEQELEKTGWLKQQEEKEDSSSSSECECCHSDKLQKDCRLGHQADLSEKFTQDVEKPVLSKRIEDLPPELLVKIFKYLPANDLCQCRQVSHLWYKLATDMSIWRDILPGQWARGDWSFQDKTCEFEQDDPSQIADDFITLDDDADIDESENNSYSALIQRVRNEARILSGLSAHILPKVGHGVQKLVLAQCRTLSNGLLQRFLSLCPNVEHLDLSHTKITDAGLRRLGKNGCGNKLRTINLSGCVNITDATMVRLAMALSNNNKACVDEDDLHKSRCADNSISFFGGHCSSDESGCDVEVLEPPSCDTECLCERYYEMCHTSLQEACARSCGISVPSPDMGRVQSREADGRLPASCKSCATNRKEYMCHHEGHHHGKLGSGQQMPRSVCDHSSDNYSSNNHEQHGCSSCHQSQHAEEDPHNHQSPQINYSSKAGFRVENDNAVLKHSTDATSCHAYCKANKNTAGHLHTLEDCFPNNVASPADQTQPSSLQYEVPQKSGDDTTKWYEKRCEDDRVRYLESINLSGCYQITDLGLKALSGSGVFPYLRLIDFSGLFRISGPTLHDLVAVCPSLNANNLYYCDNIIAGPFPDTASGCRNLECGTRVCCRSGD